MAEQHPGRETTQATTLAPWAGRRDADHERKLSRGVVQFEAKRLLRSFHALCTGASGVHRCRTPSVSERYIDENRYISETFRMVRSMGCHHDEIWAKSSQRGLRRGSSRCHISTCKGVAARHHERYA
jgi:hypothetical protein